MSTAVALTPAAKVPTQQEFLHDVFISYNPRDLNWVKDFLLPQLEQAGLQVIIDYRDYVIGLPKLKNLEQAIDTSRFTLAVLTPSWVESEWQDWEGLLTSVEGIARRKRRLIPLLLEVCQPPPHIASLSSADFTQPQDRAEEMQRLLRNLLRDRSAGPSPQRGLTALFDLTRRNPAVHASVIKSQAALKAVAEQIRLVTAYKQIHDCFQTLESACDLLGECVKRLPSDATAWEDLELHETLDFRPPLEELIDKTRQASFASAETRWLAAMELDAEKLRAAIEDKDVAACRAVLDHFDDILCREPSRINTKLFDKANELRLTGTPEKPGLVEELTEIENELNALDLSGKEAEERKAFHDCIATLRQYDADLSRYIACHNIMQGICDEANAKDPFRFENTEQFQNAWDYQDRGLEDLRRADRLACLVPLWEQVGTLKKEMSASRNLHRIKRLFLSYQGVVNITFNKINQELKDFCEQKLSSLGASLATLMERMQHE